MCYYFICIILGIPIGGISMFEHKNEYPVILIPGVVAYGENTKAHKVFPYFGLTSTGWQRVISDSMGVECHTVSFELLSSVWDRACEL